MERAGWHYPSGEIRVSDADRDQALSELRTALAAGRVTADEFDERAAQALGARTGTDLTALLADLPVEHPTAELVIAEQPDRLFAMRVAVGASAIGATMFGLAAAGAALSRDAILQQQQFMREQLALQGATVSAAFRSATFNWAGVIAPGVIALLFVIVAVVLGVRLARADRG